MFMENSQTTFMSFMQWKMYPVCINRSIASVRIHKHEKKKHHIMIKSIHFYSESILDLHSIENNLH